MTAQFGATFGGNAVTVTGELVGAVQGATREAVNASALAITSDARRRTQDALGPEQRLSGVIYRQNRNGRRGIVSAGVRAKGGTRINPYYRDAHSETKPVALVGVRGPAQYIEHRRKGGYDVRPVHTVGVDADTRAAADDLVASLVGPGPRSEAKARQAKLRGKVAAQHHPPALKIGALVRAAAHPGPVLLPPRPITHAFGAANRTMERVARDAFAAQLERDVAAHHRTV